MTPQTWNYFIYGSVGIVVFSWFVSIREKRYHGIPRFFAFESLLLLFLLNKPVWFRDPGAPLQLMSWVLLAGSLYLAVHAMVLMVSLGRPKGGNFENTTRIVTTGLYRYIRHPMYASLFYLGTGIWLKDPNAATTNLALLNLLALLITARMEEREMTARFGYAYRLYMDQTKMFLPYVF